MSGNYDHTCINCGYVWKSNDPTPQAPKKDVCGLCQKAKGKNLVQIILLCTNEIAEYLNMIDDTIISKGD